LSENDLQLAVADSQANARLSANSANKLLYIVRVEEPGKLTSIRTYLAVKITEFPQTCKVIGYEILEDNKNNNKNAQKVNTYKEVIENAEKGNAVFLDISFPWHRVVSIQNVNYQHNKNNIKR
jgi:hypothetical protein